MNIEKDTQTLIKCCSLAKAPKIAGEFNNNNVDNSDYFATSTFNNVVRSQDGSFLSCMKTYVLLGNFLTNFIHLPQN